MSVWKSAVNRATILPAQVPQQILIHSITQATRARFTELYFRLTSLFFIQRGSKYVWHPSQGEMLGEEGDLVIFPPGAMVTMENRPVMNDGYRALGVCFPHELVASVFSDVPRVQGGRGVRIVRAAEHNPCAMLKVFTQTLHDDELPEMIRQHRLLEPLLWLREQGFTLPTQIEDDPISQVRRLIETDLSHPWMAHEVAGHFAMSEVRALFAQSESFCRNNFLTRSS